MREGPVQGMEAPLFCVRVIDSWQRQTCLASAFSFRLIKYAALHSLPRSGIVPEKEILCCPRRTFLCLFCSPRLTHFSVPFHFIHVFLHLHHLNSNYDSQVATSSAVGCSARTICTEQCHTTALHLFYLLITCVHFIS